VAKYKISYGGRWRGTYSTLEQAEAAAEIEAAHLNEIVFVIEMGPLRTRFVTAYPPEHLERAKAIWGKFMRSDLSGGSG
jgi:hypothetical protein